MIRENLMSEENIENITKSDSNIASIFVAHHVLPDVNFNGHCFIKNISVPRKVINLYVSYILNPSLRNLNTDFKLTNCLFGSVKLTKNVDLDKYKYSGYVIAFHSRSEFAFKDRSLRKNVILFGIDMSSSVHIDNINKDILIIGEGQTQGLDDTILRSK